MTADVSPDDQRPPTSIRDSGGSMPFSEADFTRDAARLVAEGDRVPAQREELPAVVWVDPGRMAGQPCIYGTRLTTQQVARMVEDYGIQYVRDGWPDLSDEQIEGACWFERTYAEQRRA